MIIAEHRSNRVVIPHALAQLGYPESRLVLLLVEHPPGLLELVNVGLLLFWGQIFEPFC